MRYEKKILSFLKKKSPLPKLIVIYWPTASGKTDISLQIAQKIDGEIISADSRQIYKWMDIGTGKIKKKEMQWVPHHLLDILTPDTAYSVGQYKQDTLKVIKKIQKKWKTPILCWGTGLYIDAVIYDFEVPNVPGDEKIRKKYEKMAEKYGKEYVFAKLEKIDPEYAKMVHPNNLQYVIRGIEVKLLTGTSKLASKKEKKLLYDTLFITPYSDKNREKLYKKIDVRVKKMFETGLVEEVQKLSKKYGKNAPWLEAIGYTEVMEFLEGNISLETCVSQVQQNSRNYAKRQVTWFRKYT